jgi:hypothetical protein
MSARSGRRSGFCLVDDLYDDWCWLVLRSARRFDWATTADLAVAIDVPEIGVNRQRRQCFNQAICRLTSRGFLERCGCRMAHRYRITAAGRDWYRLQLERCAA